VLSWVAPTSTPAAGKSSIYYNGTSGRYTVVNNTGGSVTFGVAFIASRNAS
jgi:hypothetical protein